MGMKRQYKRQANALGVDLPDKIITKLIAKDNKKLRKNEYFKNNEDVIGKEERERKKKRKDKEEKTKLKPQWYS